MLDRHDVLLIVHPGRVGDVTNASAREWLALDRDETRRALRRLLGKGIFVQHGERGSIRYSLAEALGMPFPNRLEQKVRQQVVLQLAEECPVTNALVRERLDLGRARRSICCSPWSTAVSSFVPARSEAPGTSCRVEPTEQSTSSRW